MPVRFLVTLFEDVYQYLLEMDELLIKLVVGVALIMSEGALLIKLVDVDLQTVV